MERLGPRPRRAETMGWGGPARGSLRGRSGLRPARLRCGACMDASPVARDVFEVLTWQVNSVLVSGLLCNSGVARCWPRCQFARLAPISGRRASHEAALAPQRLYQPTVRPLCHHFIELSCALVSAFAVDRFPGSVVYPAIASSFDIGAFVGGVDFQLFSYSRACAISAQAVQASLLASATKTTFAGLRSRRQPRASRAGLLDQLQQRLALLGAAHQSSSPNSIWDFF